MYRTHRNLAYFWTGWAAWNVLWLAYAIFVTHVWWGYVIHTSLLIISITFAIYFWRNVHEYRRTERDRQRAGPGTTHGTIARAHAAALRAGAYPVGASSGMNLPVRDDTQPYLGWKHARLIWIPGDHYLFGGVSIGKATQYGLRARARCLSDQSSARSTYGAEHHAPGENCSCGFYAHARPPADESPMQAEYVALEVELGGKVIVCTDGYRAEWQRVLNIVVPQICYSCEQKATGLAIVSDDGGPHQALPWCEEHLEGMHPLTFASITADLRVGVSWQTWK